MMKKRGFTLAEVLITLTIIGVVATMTLPALMTNTAEQQARTGLKKGINTLTEAAQMNLATEGWDFATATTANNADGINASTNLTMMNFDSLIGNRVAIDFTKGVDLPTQRVTTDEVLTTALGAAPVAVYLKDGSAIYYAPGTARAIAGDEGNMAQLGDALPVGYVVIYDTNGMSGPNILSNCAGTAAGASEVAENVGSIADFVTPAQATVACQGKGQRVIKDMFTLRLRGNIVQPEGNAATWVINGDVISTADDIDAGIVEED